MDDSAALHPETFSPSPTLRRRNSIAATTLMIPTKLALPSTPPRIGPSFLVDPNSAVTTPLTPSSALDLELASLKSSLCSSYTSLKDLIPSAAFVSSPACASPASIIGSSYDISIRNRLVKQAAWAYLQPMCSSSSNSSGTHLFHRLWIKLFSWQRNPFPACLSFVFHKLIRDFIHFVDRMIRTIGELVSR